MRRTLRTPLGRRLITAFAAAAVLLAGGIAAQTALAPRPSSADASGPVLYACITGTQHLILVGTVVPTCPAGDRGISWQGLPFPSPTPKPTASSPSPAPSPTTPTQTPTPTPSPDPTPSGSVCVLTTASGNCGPYDYPANTASNGFNTYVGPDYFNPPPGWSHTLTVTSPRQWDDLANIPAGDTAVAGYPSNSQINSSDGTNQTITAYTQITSTFTENMNANRGTSAEAAYDVWTVAGQETMLQFDLSSQRPDCQDGGLPILATVAFTEPGTTTSQDWQFCEFGSERIWQLASMAACHAATPAALHCGEQSGSVDIKAMLTWELDHGYLPAGAQLGLVGFGVEICSTGGVPEDFQVSRFSLTALPNP